MQIFGTIMPLLFRRTKKKRQPKVAFLPRNRKNWVWKGSCRSKQVSGKRKRDGHWADSVLSGCERKRLNGISSTPSTHAWNAWLAWLEQTASRKRNNGEGVLQKRPRPCTLSSFFSQTQRQTFPVRNMSKYEVQSLHAQAKGKKGLLCHEFLYSWQSRTGEVPLDLYQASIAPFA